MPKNYDWLKNLARGNIPIWIRVGNSVINVGGGIYVEKVAIRN